MSFAPQHFEEKPYNACIDCVHIGKRCDGPNFLAMSTERWCEWCHLRKEYLDWTNAKVAEISGVALVTVNRVMSGNVKDLRISTMQSITKALVNGTWGQYPCVMGETETVYVDNPELLEKCQQLQATIDSLNREHQMNQTIHDSDKQKVEYLKEQVKFKEEQMIKKDKILEENYGFIKRKNRVIAILSTFLAIAVVVIMAALVVDRLDSSKGFFWLDQISTFFSYGNETNIANTIRGL